MRRAWRWLAESPHQKSGVRILQVSIGAMILFRLLTEFPFASYLWGPHGVARSVAEDKGNLWGALLDLPFRSDFGALAVLLLVAVGAIGLVTGRCTRVATTITLGGAFLLEQRLPEILDGGDNITRLVLMYMVFLLPHRSRARPGNLSIWVHNVAVLAISFQIVVLYATSGFMKAYGDRWHHGVAMYYISQVDWFSLPALRVAFKNPYITSLATYVPMLYQIWFPVAMISRIKLTFLLFGVLFHLGIAVMMGLIAFSTVMIGLELFLISDAEYVLLTRRWFAAREVLKGLWDDCGMRLRRVLEMGQ